MSVHQYINSAGEFVPSAEKVQPNGSTPRVEDILRKQARRYRRKIYNGEVSISPQHSTPLVPVSDSTEKSRFSTGFSPIKQMSEMGNSQNVVSSGSQGAPDNNDVMTAANDALPDIAETKIISANDVMDMMESLVNETPITGAGQVLEYRNVIEKGNKHGHGIYAGPTLPRSLSYDKYKAFTTAGNLLEQQDVSIEKNGPKFILNRLQCHQKATLMGELPPDPYKVTPPSKKQMADAALAMRGMVDYFQNAQYSQCVIKKDVAVMNLQTIYDFVECSMNALNGHEEAWLGEDGLSRKFLAEQKTVRVDENGELYVYKVEADTLVPIPRYCAAERSSSLNTIRSGPYSSQTGGASSISLQRN